MFELVVDEEFCAAHAIIIGGQRERVHGHNWRVRLRVGGPGLDADGLLCDFHVVQGLLRELLARWHNGDLNETEPFSRLNPTAEVIARQIAVAIAPRLPRCVRVRSVRVTEAPGCAAIYRPSAGDQGIADDSGSVSGALTEADLVGEGAGLVAGPSAGSSPALGGGVR